MNWDNEYKHLIEYLVEEVKLDINYTHINLNLLCTTKGRNLAIYKYLLNVTDFDQLTTIIRAKLLKEFLDSVTYCHCGEGIGLCLIYYDRYISTIHEIMDKSIELTFNLEFCKHNIQTNINIKIPANIMYEIINNPSYKINKNNWDSDRSTLYIRYIGKSPFFYFFSCFNCFLFFIRISY